MKWPEGDAPGHAGAIYPSLLGSVVVFPYAPTSIVGSFLVCGVCPDSTDSCCASTIVFSEQWNYW